MVLAESICGEKPLQIEEIGLQPGEKLYEDLVTEEEVSRTVEFSDMYVILPSTKTANIMPVDIRKAYAVYNDGKTLLEPLRSDRVLMGRPRVEAMLRSAGVL